MRVGKRDKNKQEKYFETEGILFLGEPTRE